MFPHIVFAETIYSFLNLEIVKILIVAAKTIQGWNLYEEIQYAIATFYNNSFSNLTSVNAYHYHH